VTTPTAGAGGAQNLPSTGSGTTTGGHDSAALLVGMLGLAVIAGAGVVYLGANKRA
jgi:hypothetical protein